MRGAAPRMPGVDWFVCSGLPAGSILEVEPGVYSLSPEALCVAIAREVGCVQAFALAQELCSKISLTMREVSASLHLACCE